MRRCGGELAGSVDLQQPEAYASNYEGLIRSYVTALQQTSSMFRRF